MAIYIINLFIIILLYIILFKFFKTKYSKLIFCISIFIMFSLIEGLRSFEVGNDTEKYLQFYNMTNNMKWLDITLSKVWSLEPGFGLLMKLCSTFHFPPQLYLFIVAIIINGGLMYFIYKNSDNVFMSTIIFMGAEFFSLSFTALRQLIATVIVLNSYNAIKQKKVIKFFLIILLASTFHKTALIFLPVYFLKDIKINKKTIIVGICLLILAQIFLLPLITFLTEKIYTSSYIKADGSGIIQTLVILAYLLFGYLLYRNKFKNNEHSDDILFIIMYIAFLIQSLAYRISMINRLMWYFYIFAIIFLPKVVSKAEDIEWNNITIKTQSIATLIIILLFITQYIFFSMNIYNIVPYSIFKY